MTDPQPTPGAPAEPVPPVVLKKYGNRRLYDTTASRYVTLVEVEALVQRGADIVVLDAKTGADITKEILVQLLLERDEARAALPVGLLKQAVRLAGSPLKDTLARVMQDGLDAFLGSQRAVVDAQRAFSAQLAQMPLPPLGNLPWGAGAAGLPSLWNPFAAMSPPPARPDVAPANVAPAPPSQTQQSPADGSSSAAQLDTLKAELAETQALVRRLVERELDAPRSGRDRAPRKPATTGRSAPKGAPKKPSPAKSKKATRR